MFFFFFFSCSLTAKDDPRRVVLTELRIQFSDRPEGDIVYTLDDKESLEKMKNTPFVLKESCNYKISLTFRIQHELITGLRYASNITRKGISGIFSKKKDQRIFIHFFFLLFSKNF
jgi:Rho GDP-dissociation inhibitor